MRANHPDKIKDVQGYFVAPAVQGIQQNRDNQLEMMDLKVQICDLKVDICKLKQEMKELKNGGSNKCSTL
jgi:hypothetical protein